MPQEEEPEELVLLFSEAPLVNIKIVLDQYPDKKISSGNLEIILNRFKNNPEFTKDDFLYFLNKLPSDVRSNLAEEPLLFYVIKSTNVLAVRWLIEVGYKPDAKDKNRRAAIFAILDIKDETAMLEMLHLFLQEYGQSPNARYRLKNGFIDALCYAVLYAPASAVAMLVPLVTNYETVSIIDSVPTTPFLSACKLKDASGIAKLNAFTLKKVFLVLEFKSRNPAKPAVKASAFRNAALFNIATLEFLLRQEYENPAEYAKHLDETFVLDNANPSNQQAQVNIFSLVIEKFNLSFQEDEAQNAAWQELLVKVLNKLIAMGCKSYNAILDGKPVICAVISSLVATNVLLALPDLDLNVRIPRSTLNGAGSVIIEVNIMQLLMLDSHDIYVVDAFISKLGTEKVAEMLSADMSPIAPNVLFLCDKFSGSIGAKITRILQHIKPDRSAKDQNGKTVWDHLQVANLYNREQEIQELRKHLEPHNLTRFWRFINCVSCTRSDDVADPRTMQTRRVSRMSAPRNLA